MLRCGIHHVHSHSIGHQISKPKVNVVDYKYLQGSRHSNSNVNKQGQYKFLISKRASIWEQWYNLSQQLLSFPFLIPLYDKGKGNISCPLGRKEAKGMAYMSCDLVSFLWVVVKYFPLNLSHYPANGLGL